MDGVAIDEEYFVFGPFDEEVGDAIHEISGKFERVVTFEIHERVDALVFVAVLEVFTLGHKDLYLFGRAETVVGRATGFQVTHLGLYHGLALARGAVVHFKNEARRAVVLDYVAFAKI